MKSWKPGNFKWNHHGDQLNPGQRRRNGESSRPRHSSNRNAGAYAGTEWVSVGSNSTESCRDWGKESLMERDQMGDRAPDLDLDRDPGVDMVVDRNPGVDVVVDRDAGVDRDPDVDLDRDPGVDMVVDENPGVDVNRDPGVEVDGDPGVDMTRDPGVDMNRDPGVDMDENPGVDVDRDPGVDMNRDPGVDVNRDPGVDVDENPGVDMDGDPGVDMDGDPGVDLDRDPGVDVDENPGVDVDRDTGMDLDRDPGVDLDGDLDVDVDGEPVELVICDEELARKKKVLQSIEEQIIFKRASIAMKQVAPLLAAMNAVREINELTFPEDVEKDFAETPMPARKFSEDVEIDFTETPIPARNVSESVKKHFAETPLPAGKYPEVMGIDFTEMQIPADLNDVPFRDRVSAILQKRKRAQHSPSKSVRPAKVPVHQPIAIFEPPKVAKSFVERMNASILRNDGSSLSPPEGPLDQPIAIIEPPKEAKSFVERMNASILNNDGERWRGGEVKIPENVDVMVLPVGVSEEHPLKVRVKSLMETRRNPVVAPSSNKRVLEVASEQDQDQSDLKQVPAAKGFQLFLDLLNKGVDIDKMSEIVNDFPAGDAGLQQAPPALLHRSGSQGSHGEAWHADHSGERRMDATRSDNQRSSLSSNEGVGDPFGSCRTRSRSPAPVSVAPDVPDDKQKYGQDLLQDLLQTIGLDLGVEEVGKLTGRIQERLYGKKETERRSNKVNDATTTTPSTSTPPSPILSEYPPGPPPDSYSMGVEEVGKLTNRIQETLYRKTETEKESGEQKAMQRELTQRKQRSSLSSGSASLSPIHHQHPQTRASRNSREGNLTILSNSSDEVWDRVHSQPVSVCPTSRPTSAHMAAASYSPDEVEARLNSHLRTWGYNEQGNAYAPSPQPCGYSPYPPPGPSYDYTTPPAAFSHPYAYQEPPAYPPPQEHGFQGPLGPQYKNVIIQPYQATMKRSLRKGKLERKMKAMRNLALGTKKWSEWRGWSNVSGSTGAKSGNGVKNGANSGVNNAKPMAKSGDKVDSVIPIAKSDNGAKNSPPQELLRPCEFESMQTTEGSGRRKKKWERAKARNKWRKEDAAYSRMEYWGEMVSGNGVKNGANSGVNNAKPMAKSGDEVDSVIPIAKSDNGAKNEANSEVNSAKPTATSKDPLWSDIIIIEPNVNEVNSVTPKAKSDTGTKSAIPMTRPLTNDLRRKLVALKNKYDIKNLPID